MTLLSILFLLLLAMCDFPLVPSLASLGNQRDESPIAFASNGSPSNPSLPSLGAESVDLRRPWKKHKTHVLCNGQSSACKVFSDRRVCCFNRFCRDISYSPFHCGSCGHKCRHGRRCCGGACVDCRSDKNHCGRCWNVCAADEICAFGMCGYA